MQPNTGPLNGGDADFLESALSADLWNACAPEHLAVSQIATFGITYLHIDMVLSPDQAKWLKVVLESGMLSIIPQWGAPQGDQDNA